MNTVTPTSTSCQADDGTLHFQVAADTLDEAWSWLCRSRENAPDHADIWALRYCWAQTRDALLAQLLSGTYRLTPMLITGRGRKKKEAQALWSACDALVLKWAALIIAPQLAIPARCEHVKGHGGGPSSVARMTRSLVQHRWGWVCRTDVRGYYGSMNKQKLLACVFHQIQQPVLRNLITQYVHYTVEYGGEFHTPEKGIAQGCALSPLMGALYLAQMDTYFSDQENIYYARYMDDVVILAKTRWQLRRHVRALNQFFNAGGVEQHPDKTFIGRTTRGFDWMGAQMGEHGVEGIAQRAKVNHRERLRRLYERFSRRPAEGRMRMSAYRRRWKIWAMAILVSGGLNQADAGTTLHSPYPIFASSYAPSTDVKSQSNTSGTWDPTTITSSGGGNFNFYLITRLNLKLPWTIVGVDPASGTLEPKSANVIASGNCTIRYQNGGEGTTTAYQRPFTPVGTRSILSQSTAFTPQTMGTGTAAVSGISGPADLLPDIAANRVQNDGGQIGIAAVEPSCNLQGLSVDYGPLPVGSRYRVTYRPGLIWGVNGSATSSSTYFTFPINVANGGTSEFVIGNIPNCTALNIDRTNVPLGSVSRPVGGVGTPVPTASSSSQFSLTCNGNASYPMPAIATVSGGTTATAVGGDTSKMSFTDPGLYLSLLAPNSWPSGVTPGAGQTAGKPLIFGTVDNPTPLWAWVLPGTTSITTNPVVLTPKVFLSGSNWSQTYGAKTVTVRFTTNVQ